METFWDTSESSEKLLSCQKSLPEQGIKFTRQVKNNPPRGLQSFFFPLWLQSAFLQHQNEKLDLRQCTTQKSLFSRKKKQHCSKVCQKAPRRSFTVKPFPPWASKQNPCWFWQEDKSCSQNEIPFTFFIAVAFIKLWISLSTMQNLKAWDGPGPLISSVTILPCCQDRCFSLKQSVIIENTAQPVMDPFQTCH